MTGELFSMKKFALPLAAVLALLSIAGCAQYYGKGKAPLRQALGGCEGIGRRRSPSFLYARENRIFFASSRRRAGERSLVNANE